MDSAGEAEDGDGQTRVGLTDKIIVVASFLFIPGTSFAISMCLFVFWSPPPGTDLEWTKIVAKTGFLGPLTHPDACWLLVAGTIMVLHYVAIRCTRKLSYIAAKLTMLASGMGFGLVWGFISICILALYIT